MKEREFISYWLNNFQHEGIRDFPQDFIPANDSQTINLPGKTLLLGKEFFGDIEILTIDGLVFRQVKSIHFAKYIIYANRNLPSQTYIPDDEIKISEAVNSYEDYIDSIIRLIGTDYKKKFPGEKNQKTVVNNILRAINLIRY
ncbi:MAG: hypothetical protein IPM56_00965 [Ignavibacteriales bacterium]|nr:MAG: hypothetical protein IPM56_00965 [Ignavibacteriales bacterium]